MAVDVRPDVNHPVDAAPADREQVERVAADVQTFEGGIGPDFHERCNKWFRQYGSFRRFRGAWKSGNENDRDEIVRASTQQWGAQLHIPMSFRTIETMVPRAISQRPRILVLPRAERWEENVESVRMLLDSQQDNIDIDLPFQSVMRSGRIYGIGFGKSYWCREYGARRRTAKRTLRPGYVTGGLEQVTTFDDPMFEDMDVFDVMWDPTGSTFRGPGRCQWVVHRIWMPLPTVLERFKSGTWATQSAQALAAEGRLEERLRSMGNGQKYDEIWTERMQTRGFGAPNVRTRGEQLHEVWEWHDGDRVLTVLDRQVLVQDGENPCVGHLPFVAYRPTPLQKMLVGIGDLEPLEHLQADLDTLRSQRIDFRTIALNAGYAFDSSMIDREDLVFGPGAAIEARNAGDIRNAIMPLPVREMPASAIQEEQVIRQDFDLVPGLADSADQQGAPASTATEAQLVQAALSARIELGSRRFEIEVVRNVARIFLYLDQRMILQQRQLKQPSDGLDYQQSADVGRWQWVQVGPGELQGEFEIVPEGGSMAARNVPQDRQDALQLMQLFGSNPYVEPQRVLLKALKLFGVDQPETWLKQSEQPVPPAALEYLKTVVDPNVVDYAVQQAQQQDPMLSQDGGGVDQAQGVTQ